MSCEQQLAQLMRLKSRVLYKGFGSGAMISTNSQQNPLVTLPEHKSQMTFVPFKIELMSTYSQFMSKKSRGLLSRRFCCDFLREGI